MTTKTTTAIVIPTVSPEERAAAANRLGAAAKTAYLEGRAGDAANYASHAATLIGDLDKEATKGFADLAAFFSGPKRAIDPPAPQK